MNATGKRRLLKLADFLATKVPPKHFDITTWWCGSTGCALGWAAKIPSFRKAGYRCDFEPEFHGKCNYDAAASLFSISFDDAKQLFSSKLNPRNIKPPKVAANIRAFVKRAA